MMPWTLSSSYVFCVDKLSLSYCFQKPLGKTGEIIVVGTQALVFAMGRLMPDSK